MKENLNIVNSVSVDSVSADSKTVDQKYWGENILESSKK